MSKLEGKVQEKIGELIESLIVQLDGETGQEFCDREADLRERLGTQTHNFLVDEGVI